MITVLHSRNAMLALQLYQTPCSPERGLVPRQALGFEGPAGAAAHDGSGVSHICDGHIPALDQGGHGSRPAHAVIDGALMQLLVGFQHSCCHGTAGLVMRGYRVLQVIRHLQPVKKPSRRSDVTAFLQNCSNTQECCQRV